MYKRGSCWIVFINGKPNTPSTQTVYSLISLNIAHEERAAFHWRILTFLSADIMMDDVDSNLFSVKIFITRDFLYLVLPLDFLILNCQQASSRQKLLTTYFILFCLHSPLCFSWCTQDWIDSFIMVINAGRWYSPSSWGMTYNEKFQGYIHRKICFH
jgi:hypothetical protein